MTPLERDLQRLHAIVPSLGDGNAPVPIDGLLILRECLAVCRRHNAPPDLYAEIAQMEAAVSKQLGVARAN